MIIDIVLNFLLLVILVLKCLLQTIYEFCPFKHKIIVLQITPQTFLQFSRPKFCLPSFIPVIFLHSQKFLNFVVTELLTNTVVCNGVYQLQAFSSFFPFKVILSLTQSHSLLFVVPTLFPCLFNFSSQMTPLSQGQCLYCHAVILLLPLLH